MTRRALLFLLAGAASLLAQANPDWHKEFPAFKIAGNLYYVGTVSHAHGDHDAATGLIKKDTDAKLMVMDADVAEEESTAPGRPGAHVDRALHDGETVELGGSKLVAHLTPGHTKGCTTWTMQVREGARTLNAVIVGSPNVNPGYKLVGNADYPEIADDFARTFRVLKGLPCDVFLGAHGGYYGMVAKHERAGRGAGANPFVDPEGYRDYVAQKDKAFRDALAAQRGPKPAEPAR